MADDTVTNTGNVESHEAAEEDEVHSAITHPASSADAAAFFEVNNLAAQSDGEDAEETLSAVPQGVTVAVGPSGIVPRLV